MADLIYKLDSLNTGRKKLNEAIEHSNKSLSESEKALLKAVDSMDLSERTQKELTQAILEGDSSPLGGQLSVGADGSQYDGPQERLVAENKELMEKFDEVATEDKLGRVIVDGKTIKSNNNGLISVKNHKSPVRTPSGFDWLDHPLKNKIYDDGLGNFTIKDFDIRKYKPVGKVYYVDKNVGSDANDGLSLKNPLKSVRAAFDKKDCVVIKVAEGIYSREESMFGRIIDRDISIEALPGHDVLMTGASPVYWNESDISNAYEADTTNVEFILDMRYKNEFGDPVEYELVESPNDVSKKKGTYYVGGGKLYIRTFDDSEPNNENILRFADGNAITVMGNCTVYLDGIKQWGGDRALSVSRRESNEVVKVFANNCEFKYSNGKDFDVVLVLGADLAVFQNCIASNGKKDGFNYGPQFDNPTKAVEINCVGKHNGTPGSSSDQGSTQHNGGKIIRINSLYHNNFGANTAESGLGSQAWMLGCSAYNPLASDTYRQANYEALENVEIWMDSCVSYDAPYSDLAGKGVAWVKNNNLLSDKSFSDSVTVKKY